MLSRRHMVLVAFLLLMLALAACGKDKPPEAEPPPPTESPALATATPQAAVPVATARPVSPVVRASTPTPVSAPPPTSTPAKPVNGGSPAAVQVSLGAADELSTVEVVKILQPSVVQIITETLPMGAGNQPLPSQGVGTVDGLRLCQ